MLVSMADSMYLRFHAGEVEGEECGFEAMNQKGNIPRRATLNELAYTPIPECFLCPLCEEVFKEATTAVPCGCVFCRECITDHVQKENPVCVVVGCHTPLENTGMRRSIPMQKGVDKLQVRCEHGLSYSLREKRFTPSGWKSNGCTAVVLYSEYEKHIQVCKWALLPCPNKCDGCPAVCTREDMPSHESECEYGKYICECGEAMALRKLEEHKVNCSLRSVSCKHEHFGCEASVKAVELEEHLETCMFEAHFRVAQIAIEDCLSAARRKLLQLQQNNGQTEGLRESQVRKIQDDLLSMMRIRTQTVSNEEIREDALGKFQVELEGLGFFSRSSSSSSTSPGRSSFDGRMPLLLESVNVGRQGGEEIRSSERVSSELPRSPILGASLRSGWSSLNDGDQSPLLREGSGFQSDSGSERFVKSSSQHREPSGSLQFRSTNSLGSTHGGSAARIYTLAQIMDATKSFSEHNCIGRGAFGAVYRGMLQGTQVAVKRLFREGSGFPLEAEVAVLQKLRHPNVVLLIGCSPEAQCIVSEYLSGGSIQDRLKGDRSTLRWTDRIRICSEMAAALLYMHSLRILHRDLKPANVLLSQDGTCKLCDMGLATLLDFTTRQSIVKGTIGYMDPHWVSTGEYSAATDVYGLGLIILQLVTGQAEIKMIHQYLDCCGEKRDSEEAVSVIFNQLDHLAGPWPSELVSSLLRVALRCVERRKSSRPDLESVVQPELQRIYLEVSQDERRGSTDVNPAQREVEEFTKMANAGIPEAQNEVGNCYRLGYGVVKSPWEAVNWYTKAAHEGYSQAEYNLGLCYEQGEGVEQNSEAAVKWYEKAARQGHAKAQNSLGDCYKNGKGVPSDVSIAVQWYIQAAEAGDPGAQFNLGLAYLTGQGLPEKLDLAVDWFRKAAEQRHPGAMNNLGYCHKAGKGVKKNLEEAAKWYEIAAKGGHPASQNNLGNCYANAEGVLQDYDMAAMWYLEAAKKNYPPAQQNVAMCYSTGKGVPKDVVTAAYWFRRGAENGSPHSQLELGRCYKNGNGVEQCHRTAVQWFRKAAEQKNAEAQNELAVCYFKGEGVEESASEAVQWWRRAAEQYNTDAQYHLADCLISATGTKRNISEAKTLLKLAAEKGHSRAKTRLKPMGLLYSFNNKKG